jgi:hypothetical protein
MVSVLDTLPDEAGAIAVVARTNHRPRRVSRGLFACAAQTSTRRRRNAVAPSQRDVAKLALMRPQRFPFGYVISV